ncbi:MAG TPA: PAS domain S-box protein [Opitutaceae bacterium]
MKDEQGHYVFANDSALRVFGQSSDSLLGRTDTDIFPPEIAEQFRRNDRIALGSESGMQTVETLPHHDDNRLHHSLVSKFPIPATDGGPMLVGGMAIDITEKRDAEIRIQQLAAIVESSEDAILSQNLDGVLTSWNRGAARLFGCTAEEMVGLSIMRLIPPDRQGEEAVIIERLRRGENIEHYETVRVRKDGGLLDVSLSVSPIKGADGTTIGVSKIARDITGRKRTEAELRRREQLYRAVGESIDYGVWVCDRTGRNTYASESFLKLVGLSQQECAEFGWGSVLHPDEAEETIAAWQECARTGAFWEREHRMRGVDGAWHPILARGVPVRDENGEIVSWVGINLDILRLKQNEEVLRQQTRNLEVLNRVGRMLAAERELEPLVQAVTDAGREVSGAAFGAFFYNVENENGASYRLYSLSGAGRD